MIETTKTNCPYCGVGCGVLAKREPGNGIAITGNGEHPANFGKLCSKGSALGETLGLDGRLLSPTIDGQRADWETALTRVAAGLGDTIAQHGPDAVAFYVSGQLLTEDYYVANKLMKGFIGSANIDTNSRLCMASSVAGHKRAFGADAVPCSYEDLEEADLVVLAGSNAAWCHPILYQRIAAQQSTSAGKKLVVIDPRRTASCSDADLHLALKPGTDAILFNGLLAYLDSYDAIDMRFVNCHTEGLHEALQAAKQSAASAAEVAALCGLSQDDVLRFFHWFKATKKTVTVYSQGINQSSSGTDKVNAIINCHLFTGRIGRPGMGPFSFTGQPNAMGGREVGGMANQLAAHMEIENPSHRERVQRFWGARGLAEKPGLKAVDLFDAIGDGRVKAVWIMATNPAVSLPDGDRIRDALKACDLVILSDCVRRTDTAAFADVLLPAAAWGEKDGTVTNSERRLSRQRAFLHLPGEAKPDWWIVTQVARRMGFEEAFSFESPAAIFREHAALSGFENSGGRAFDISSLAEIDDDAYDSLIPVQWPVTRKKPSGTPRLFTDGRFFTASGKAQFISITPRLPAHGPDDEFPLALNTGRTRDHWHTLTRTGISPRLSQHDSEPIADIHPKDAEKAGIQDGALIRATSHLGEMFARARITEDLREGNVFLPMHWNDQFAAKGRADALIDAVCDPVSGQPELKHAPIRLTPYAPQWKALAFSRQPLALEAATYWVRSAEVECWRYEFAGDALPDNPESWARGLLGFKDEKDEWIAYRDTTSQHYRFAVISGGRLQACLFVLPDFASLSRSWLASLFAEKEISPAARTSLLAGAMLGAGEDDGPMICACYGVRRKQITAAIETEGLATVEAIGERLQAGTSCGSCKPELRNLLPER